MFHEEYQAVVEAAKKKLSFSRQNPGGYLLAAMLSGMFIAFGVLLAYTSGSLTAASSFSKLIMGMTFCVALALVVIAGSELFTGNTFILSCALFRKKIRIRQAARLWAVCYLGNWIGAVMIALLFQLGNFCNEEVSTMIAESAQLKMQYSFLSLLLRSIFCNVLVCLALWCTFRCKSEGGKLFMIFLCLLTFIVCGFEHSIANMIILTMSLLEPCGMAVSAGGYIYNLSVATIGNMIGAIFFLALPYHLISRQKE